MKCLLSSFYKKSPIARFMLFSIFESQPLKSTAPRGLPLLKFSLVTSGTGTERMLT